MENVMKVLGKLKLIIVTVVVVLICVVACFITWNVCKKTIKPVEVTKKVEVPVEKIVEKDVVISGETIKAGLNNIGKLCTAEYYYTHVEHFDSAKEINGFEIPFTTSQFIYSYDGTVLAGIDFTKVDVSKDEEEKLISVTLPAVEIISSDVDQDSFQLYDEKNNIFNPISVTDVTDSFADLKNTEEKKAVEKGLFERAEENARSLVENFMQGSYNVDDYDIVVNFAK